MAKTTYADIAALVANENKGRKAEIIKNWSVNSRVNIKTGEVISKVVTLYFNGKFTYDAAYIEDVKQELNAFSFSVKVFRSQLVLMYDISTDDFEGK